MGLPGVRPLQYNKFATGLGYGQQTGLTRWAAMTGLVVFFFSFFF